MLVNCTVYEDGKRLGNIATEDIGKHVGRRDRFVWVALKDPEPEELAEMQREFGLHELAVEDARHGHQRPKIDEYGDSLFAVLHTVDIGGGELVTGEVHIFVGRNYVVSVRHDTEQSFAGVRERCELEPELLKRGAGFVLYAIMDAVVDRYFPVLDALETELEQLEKKIFAGGSARVSIEALYALKQKLMTLKHAVEPLLESTGKLWGGRVPQVCQDTQEYFRDVYDHLVRIGQSIDILREMMLTALTVNLSLITLQENETTKRLAAYAALVAVPTMLAGIYGMNFRHMPELEWQYGYPVAVAVMALIDVYLFARFRKAGWL